MKHARIALISDPHANIHALRSVAAHLETQRWDHLICLGDLVGYNATPLDCIDWIKNRCDIVVTGNHDRDVAVSADDDGTSSSARHTQAWTRKQLRDDHRTWLAGLNPIHVEAEAFVAVHGCFINKTHVNGYVTSTMIGRNLAAVAANDNWPKLAFCGHTHQPMIAWIKGEKEFEFKPQGVMTYPSDADAVLVNPGSIGQPRDGDPRAAYAIVDLQERTVEVHRVEYDIRAAQEDILAAGFPERFATRLEEGR